MESKAIEIQPLIDTGRPTLVVCMAEWCAHCAELKSHMPELIEAAQALHGVTVRTISATDKDNENFLTKNPFETLPYCLVFVDGEFKGGDSVDKEGLEKLTALVGQRAKAGAA